MSVKIRAKFKVTQRTQGLTTYQTITLNPTYSSDPNDENKLFWDATPGGKIEMNVSKNGDLFELGAEYYVDFIKVEKPE
jgi:hypothetical protein